MIRLCAFSDEAGSPLPRQIEALKRNNIRLCEMRSVDGKNVLDFEEDEARRYKKELDAHGISVWSVGSPIGKVDISVDFSEYEKKVRHACRLANIFGADRIRMFSFFGAYDRREQVLDYLSRMVKIASEYGVFLCHENEKEVYGDTLSRVLDIAENAEGLRLVYDPANFVQCGERAIDTLSALAGRADYFHIKDVDASDGSLVPAGYGDGDIPSLISSIDRDTVLTLEPHLAIFEGYAQIDNTEMKHKLEFKTSDEAFDFAALSLKKLLLAAGYHETNGGFTK